MSNEILTVSITVLADGKLSVYLTGGKEIYIQPPLVVDTLDANSRLVILGEDKQTTKVDVTISEIDGVPFVGNFAALETAVRDMAVKANTLHYGGSGSGTIGTRTQVAASLTVVTLKAANAARKSLIIKNVGASVLYFAYGAAATLADYTESLADGESFIIADYSGIVTGLWDVAVGGAKITETT